MEATPGACCLVTVAIPGPAIWYEVAGTMDLVEVVEGSGAKPCSSSCSLSRSLGPFEPALPDA